MAHIFADRVIESTSTTGTGPVALAGAVAGFQRFNAVMAGADTCDYSIFAIDNNGVPTGDWETGVGTYLANTLTRTTVSASSNAGAPVAFAAGQKQVMLGFNAASVIALSGGGGGSTFKGARLLLAGDFTVYASADFEYVMNWDHEVFDTDGFYDSSAPSRLTVPTGVSYVNMTAGMIRDAGGNGYAIIRIHHFDSAGTELDTAQSSTNTDTSCMAWLNVSSGPLAVSPGDYFTASYQAHNYNGPLAGGQRGCFFAIHAL